MNKLINESDGIEYSITGFPGRYIQGAGVLKLLQDFAKPFGDKVLMISSKTVVKNILPKYNFSESFKMLELIEFQGECSETELNRISELAAQKEFNIVIGLGGGKVIDTAKIIADRHNKDVIIAPTIASTDAPCSAVAVIYTDDGVFESVYHQKQNPQIVLVDTEVISQAPVRFLIAGMGDALATWFEARSCYRTNSNNEFGTLASLSGLTLAELCYNTLLEFGYTAKIAAENQLITPALDKIIEANTLLSGIGFESVGVAAAHSIHNGLSAIKETRQYYHGEKVAFGVLAGFFLNDSPPSEIDTVYSFCQEIGLPTTLAEIGIKEIISDDLRIAAEKSLSPVESIHKEPVRLTPEKVVNAMLMADAYGREFSSFM